ncbi:hypothetical protein HJFPF1_09527 [Paramyrothecium foliicola]|nr:hypothetical protein HJFPF1_09527 [Paramyrothecium foliicola]
MKFSGLLSIALATVGANAAPALEERQAIGIINVQFFPEADCQGALQAGQVFVQYQNAGVCQAVQTPIGAYPSFRVRQITDVTSPLTIFGLAGCTGPTVTVTPSTPINTCFNQKVGSGRF